MYQFLFQKRRIYIIFTFYTNMILLLKIKEIKMPIYCPLTLVHHVSFQAPDNKRLSESLEAFRKIPVRKHIVISQGRTLGTAVGRHIASSDYDPMKTNSRSVFLDEIITKGTGKSFDDDQKRLEEIKKEQEDHEEFLKKTAAHDLEYWNNLLKQVATHSEVSEETMQKAGASLFPNIDSNADFLNTVENTTHTPSVTCHELFDNDDCAPSEPIDSSQEDIIKNLEYKQSIALAHCKHLAEQSSYDNLQIMQAIDQRMYKQPESSTNDDDKILPKDIVNITLHEYPNYILHQHDEASSDHKTQEFLSSFDTITLTIRAPLETISSAVKAHLDTYPAANSFKDHIISQSIKSYISQMQKLSALIDLSTKNDMNHVPVHVIDTTEVTEKMCEDITNISRRNTTPDSTKSGNAYRPEEYIETYGSHRPDNIYKASSLSPNFKGVKPTKTMNNYEQKRLTEQELGEDDNYQAAVNLYMELKKKVHELHKKGKLKYITSETSQ